jgi:hypothetical protein
MYWDMESPAECGCDSRYCSELRDARQAFLNAIYFILGNEQLAKFRKRNPHANVVGWMII